MSLNFSMTIKRADLIQTLETRRTEIAADFDSKIKEVQDEASSRGDTAAQLAQWHQDVAKLLADGDVKMSATGKLKPTRDEVEVPVKPTPSTTRQDRSQVKYEVEGLEQNKESALSRIDSALRLLKLATDDEITIPASEYEQLLNQRANRRYYY